MNKVDRIYPGIVAALPLLHRSGAEPVRLINLAHEFHYLLHPEDQALLQLAYLPIDHDNLLNRLFGQQQLVAGGNYPDDQIARIARGEESPFPYWEEFLRHFTTSKMTFPEAERALTTAYYRFLLDGPSALLKRWANLQLELRLAIWTREEVPSWLRADVEAIRPLREDEPTALPEELARLVRDRDLWQREAAIDQWFWDELIATVRFDPYSPDALIGYALRSLIATRWTAFQVTPGKERLHQLILSSLPN